MRIDVDLTLCQSYAHCTFEAPDVFELDDDDVLHWSEQASADRQHAVREAARSCPVAAITLTETHAPTIDRTGS